MSDKQSIEIKTLAQIKEMVLDAARADGCYAAQDNGDVKRIYASRSSYDRKKGCVAIFYKNCKPFETHKGLDTRPVEMFTFTIEPAFDEGIDDELTLDLWLDCNEKDEDWQAKLEEKMSDKDFFDYYKSC
jgi:hypothetical protein